MSNLPITSNASQPGNPGNALQAGNSVDENNSRRYPARGVGAGSDAQSASTAKSNIGDSSATNPESFADLLNRQFVISDSLTPVTNPIVADGNSIASGGAKTAKEFQQCDLPASATPVDASGMLAGMMQNFTSAQQKPSSVGEIQDKTPRGKTTGKVGREMQDAAPGEVKKIPVLTSTEIARTNIAAPGEVADNMRVTGPQTALVSPTGDQNIRSLQVTARGKPGPVNGTRNQQILPGNLPQTSDKVSNHEIASRRVDAQPAVVIPGTATPTNDLVANLEYADKVVNLMFAKSGSASANPIQAAAAAIVTSANQNPLPVTLSIAAPFGSRDWSMELAQKITWMGDQKHQVAELHLNPPDLGPLDVVLKISGNQATATFTSSHSAVRDAVENAIPKLRDMLADNGIMLGNASVSDQAPQHGRGDGPMNQGLDSNPMADMRSSTALLPEATASSTTNAPARRHNGLVDTFA
ncbi:MAG: flagellar hook-length control protein FliK [Gallionella sp.]